MLDPLVVSTLDRLERSFEALSKDNIPDHLTIKRSELELTIEVKGTGPYRMFVDDQLGVFCMQSPESGLFHYEWQEADKRWFPGTIRRVYETAGGEQRIDVDYDDGDFELNVLPRFVRPRPSDTEDETDA